MSTLILTNNTSAFNFTPAETLSLNINPSEAVALQVKPADTVALNMSPVEPISLSVKPPEVMTLKIGLTPAGIQGVQGIPGVQGPPGVYVQVTNVLGQSTTAAVSQKLFTDNLFEASQKVLLQNLIGAEDILSFTAKLDEALI